KRKVEDDEAFGEVRMALLSHKYLKPVLKELLRGLKSQNSQAYLKSNKVRRYALLIDNLLFAPYNSQVLALSLDQISIYEQNILRLMTFQMMDTCIKDFWQCPLEIASKNLSIIYNTRALLRMLNQIYWMIVKKNVFVDIRGPSVIFGSQDYIRTGSIHSLTSSDNTHSSEFLADEMIRRIGLNNWLNLIILTSIPQALSDNVSAIDPDNSLNLRETVFDVRDRALTILWNFAECSDVLLKESKNVMTTNNFRSINVISEFSDTTNFDENGIYRVKFLIDCVMNKANTKSIE